MVFAFIESGISFFMLPIENGKVGVGAYGCWWWEKPKWGGRGLGINGGKKLRGHHDVRFL